MKLRSVAVIAAGSAALLTVAGCSGSGDTHGSSGGSDGPTKITVAIPADPGKINPITNATEAGEDVTTFSYESLLSFPQDKPPVGLLASDWKITTTQAVFTLKKGITCADGSPLKASDVAATFEYAANPATGSPFRGVYFPAQGLQVTPDDGAGTVTFVAPQPQSFLAQTLGSLPIVCAAGLKDPSALDTKTFGTGPYELTTANPGQSYTFTLRDGYTWGPGGVTSKTAGLPKTVVAQVVADPSTRANLLQSGGVQIASVAGTDQKRLSSLNAAQKVSLDLRPGLVFFNQASGRPGHDLAVRQAIAAAIDRKAVGSVASQGRGKQLVNLVPDYPSVCPGADSASALPTLDVSKAKQLLDQAGWTAGPNGTRTKDGQELTLKLLYPSTEGAGVTSAIELMQQQLAKVGIKGVPTPASSYTSVIFQGGDWDLVWAPIYTTLPSDWKGILSGDFPPQGHNWTYNTNQEYFSLASKAEGYAGTDSCKFWTQAQDSLIKDLEVLPITSNPTTIYGVDVTFGLNHTLIAPTTLRVKS